MPISNIKSSLVLNFASTFFAIIGSNIPSDAILPYSINLINKVHLNVVLLMIII
ncbi:hypothetical protein [Fastidiosibacter lacustris]|uniref:hypothetical protein n=1 Tax=Fastidiosibacter lacustris TaxID=2056695 RepID=UPI0013006A76|nr:hypothetical protein [Fastidiosibacter lacustris]